MSLEKPIIEQLSESTGNANEAISNSGPLCLGDVMIVQKLFR